MFTRINDMIVNLHRVSRLGFVRYTEDEDGEGYTKLPLLKDDPEDSEYRLLLVMDDGSETLSRDVYSKKAALLYRKTFSKALADAGEYLFRTYNEEHDELLGYFEND